jgi:hypothetical protein
VFEVCGSPVAARYALLMHPHAWSCSVFTAHDAAMRYWHGGAAHWRAQASLCGHVLRNPLQVLFDASTSQPGEDHHDTLAVLSDSGTFEVPLRALAPRPRLRLLPPTPPFGGGSTPAACAVAATPLEFGPVPAGSEQTRSLRLVNEGSRPAVWKAAVDG